MLCLAKRILDDFLISEKFFILYLKFRLKEKSHPTHSSVFTHPFSPRPWVKDRVCPGFYI